MFVHILSKYWIHNLIAINEHESILLSGVLLNFIFSLITTIYLFKLTKLLFKNEKLGYITSLIFIYNPATIFFVAPYSESIFFMLTVTALYYLFNNNYLTSLILFLFSCLARSNGLINFLFISFIITKSSILHLLNDFKSKLNLSSVIKHIFRKKNIFSISKLIIILLVIFSCFLTMLSLYQYYIYDRFCLKSLNVSSFPVELIEYAKANSYSLSEFSWCNKFLPFSYTDVQSKYWNVGFLKYWQLRQIPNFLLAMPILFISIFSIKSFILSLKPSNYLINILGLKTKNDQLKLQLFGEHQPHLFVFTIHLIILVVSALFFMHVQVSYEEEKKTLLF